MNLREWLAERKKRKTYRIRLLVTVTVFTIVGLFALFVFSVLYIAERCGYSWANISSPWLPTSLLCLFCMVVSAGAHYLVVMQIFNPLERLSKGSRQIAKGNFDVRLEYEGAVDELKTTIDNFNHMARELSSVEMMRNDFIANVSHEFKTPLSSINGYLTLLQEPDLSEQERREYIQKTFFNIDRLNDLTENILRLSKLENQQYMDNPVRYRLDEQIRQAVVMLEPKWSRKNINLDIEMEEIEYVGQQQLLLQVWMNLFGNAIKFTGPEGNIGVQLRQQDGLIEVVISDDGIGMDGETMKHIFDKFYQADTSRMGQGNGLGLAICKEILSRCGGTISVESEPDKGAAFSVRLKNG